MCDVSKCCPGGGRRRSARARRGHSCRCHGVEACDVIAVGFHIVGLFAVVATFGTLGYVVTAAALAPVAVRANYPRLVGARWTWRRLCRNTALAKPDAHLKDTRKVARPCHLRARFRATHTGLVATVRTVPGTGRAELEKQADQIANQWRVPRVAISQPRPGRLLVRGLAVDPLLGQLAMSDAPPGTYDGSGPVSRILARP